MLYIINDSEGTRMTRQAPSPVAVVNYLAEITGKGKMRWIMYDGELVRSDFTPGLSAKFISFKRKSR